MWLINCRIWWSKLNSKTAEFNDGGWISEPESFAFNGNSDWTVFSCFVLYLLNGNWVCVFFIFLVNEIAFSEFSENSELVLIFFPFLIQIENFSFKSRLFPSMKNNGNTIVVGRLRTLIPLHVKIKCECLLLTFVF